MINSTRVTLQYNLYLKALSTIRHQLLHGYLFFKAVIYVLFLTCTPR
nr:MAG TPA: hypothetical protein [Caudoviricetes sp.]